MNTPDPDFSPRLTHQATVISVEGRVATVRIDSTAAGCASCRLSALCLRHGGTLLQAVLPEPAAAPPPGERVTIEAAPSGRAVALTLLLAVPVVLLTGVTALCATLTPMGEAASCLTAAGVVAVWYAAVAAMARTGRRLRWRVSGVIRQPARR